MKQIFRAIAVIVLAAGVHAQTPQPDASQAARPRPRPPTIQIAVRDHRGVPVAYVHVTVAGTVSRDVLSNADGVATLLSMPDGTYRVRFEKEGFHTLERDIVVRAGGPRDFDVELTSAAAPAPPPQAEPLAASPSTPIAAPAPPAPSVPPATRPTPAAPGGSAATRPAPTPAPAAVAPSGPPVTLSIPEYLDKNFITGREPLKESVIGCTSAATTRLLQLREPIATHTHDTDEIVYIVAGDGAIRIRVGAGAEGHDEVNALTAGSLSVIPRGAAHAIERRGRNPLILLSTLAGAPCQAATTTHQAGKQ